MASSSKSSSLLLPYKDESAFLFQQEIRKNKIALAYKKKLIAWWASFIARRDSFAYVILFYILLRFYGILWPIPVRKIVGLVCVCDIRLTFVFQFPTVFAYIVVTNDEWNRLMLRCHWHLVRLSLDTKTIIVGKKYERLIQELLFRETAKPREKLELIKTLIICMMHM